MVVPAVGRVWLFCTQTLHGTAIYTYIDPSGTTPTDRQSYGSPMECLAYSGFRGSMALAPLHVLRGWHSREDWVRLR